MILKTNSSLKPKTKMILKTSLPMFYSGSLALLMGWANVLLLGFFINESEVGIYYSIERIASLSSISLIAVNSIVAPKFSESFAKQDYIGLKNTTKKSTKMIFFTTVPLLVILSIFGKQILQLFGGGIHCWLLGISNYVFFEIYRSYCRICWVFASNDWKTKEIFKHYAYCFFH